MHQSLEAIKDASDDLAEYLLDHEGDIGDSMNDFGRLASAFELYFGREPRESDKITLDGDG